MLRYYFVTTFLKSENVVFSTLSVISCILEKIKNISAN